MLLDCVEQMNFNSTMVRLRFGSANGVVSMTLFQFHNGAIKIRRMAPGADRGKDFNSTMVRLRSRDLVDGVAVALEFQFHNGAIKIVAPAIIRRGVHEFQFHNGAIKIWTPPSKSNNTGLFQFHNGAIKMLPIRLYAAIWLYFNSTMVRLR